MRTKILLFSLLSVTACDRIDQLRQRVAEEDTVRAADPSSRLALSLEPPEMLDWGAEGAVRLTLSNHADTAVSGVQGELYLPAWIEFGAMEPAGMEIRLMVGSDGTRLTYPLADPALGPGESRTVLQRVRVIPADPGAAAATIAAERRQPAASPDSPIAAAAPPDRVLRARLVTAAGQTLGAEILTSVPFRGAPRLAGEQLAPGVTSSERARPMGEQTVLSRQGIGELRIRMSATAARALAGTRDTTWRGPENRDVPALVVPFDDQRWAFAVLDADTVERIIVLERAIATPEGAAVGTRLDQLRSMYGGGGACADVLPDGRAVVGFRQAPGMRFVLDHRPGTAAQSVRADPATLPASATVREIWVEDRSVSC